MNKLKFPKVEHYEKFKIQPIEFIMTNNLSFPVGNVIKYICRYEYKDGISDLKKAKDYIDFIINNLEDKENDFS